MAPDQIGVGDVRISDREKELVKEVLDSNRLGYGPFSQKLERDFAKLHGCKHCILTNSGTSSLHLALAALKEKHGWQDGDEVLCPAGTFVATSNVILQNSLTPVFVDVEKDSYNIDPALIEERITPKARAIMVVHLYGQPADMDPILAIAKKRDLHIIEDSCETMLATYKGKTVGSFGDIACFSSYACHIMVTGVGGLTTTKDKELAVLLRSLANHGRDSIYISIDDDKGKEGKGLKEVMERRFSFIRNGYSYRTTEMEAALGYAQLENLKENVEKRKSIAKQLTAGLQQWDKVLQLPRIMDNRDHVFMMYPIIIKEGAPFDRETITLFLEEKGIETRHMVSLLDQPVYRQLLGEDIEDEYPVLRI